jgi:chorismate synthase
MVDLEIEGRHDTCIALRIPVIIEAATAIVLVDFMMQAQMIGRVWR